MSTANELLRRAWKECLWDLDFDSELREEIVDFLDSETEAEPVYVDAPSAVASNDVPETDFGMTEPVAWVPEDELPERYPYNFMFQYSKVDIIRWFPIYGPPRPEPARKPLSDVEIADIYYRGTCFEKGYLSAFAEGFRQAEKHYLIGVSDE